MSRGIAWPAPVRAPLPPVRAWTGVSEGLIRPADDPWISPAEASGFDTTPGYAETLHWLERLAQASPLIRLESLSRSVEGRDLLLVIASRDPDRALTPGGGHRPRLLVQCGIHPGEIDGKDAGLMLLRDIVLGDRGSLLDGADWLFIPILNPDGHERTSAFNRPNQRGPSNQGWRTNAQNLNLNRDYMKADSPEMQALLGLLGRIDPDLYIDLHVTDGLDYQYDITFGFQDAPYSLSPATNAWLEGSFRPAVDAALADAGHHGGPLVLAVDDREPALGLTLPAFPACFSHGYGDARHIPTVLVENHSLKPVRQRVLGTYVLIAQSLALLAREADILRRARDEDRARRSRCVTTHWVARKDPVRQMLFHPIASEHYVSPVTGAREVRWLGSPEPATRVPLYGSRPASTEARPNAYWIPAGEREAIACLARHGIRMAQLAEPHEVEVEMIRFERCEFAGVGERRPRLIPGPIHRETRRETFAPGSVRIPLDQPLGTLAMLLVEPSSPDSLFATGHISGMVDATDYLEAYVVAPMGEAMLARSDALRDAFETRLANDAEFAADPMARLRWFYARSPYADARHLLYPVGIERQNCGFSANIEEPHILTRMFAWWNDAYLLPDAFTETAFARYFTRDAELIVNGELRAHGLAGLVARFCDVKRLTDHVRIELPFIDSFASADGRRVYTRHRAHATIRGMTETELISGWAELRGGLIRRLDFVSVILSA
ncbi:M14 family metallopeptidase [Rhizorhabdus sp. FW153]|uniref:M14 family metallopeptidase n=1 Tax=Rhizorhabdus sp. FW153 TaxID=3400216 RepID=UPI003CE8BE99